MGKVIPVSIQYLEIPPYYLQYFTKCYSSKPPRTVQPVHQHVFSGSYNKTLSVTHTYSSYYRSKTVTNDGRSGPNLVLSIPPTSREFQEEE